MGIELPVVLFTNKLLLHGVCYQLSRTGRLSYRCVKKYMSFWMKTRRIKSWTAIGRRQMYQMQLLNGDIGNFGYLCF
ncbi:hypothetical protein evm_007379 [Chilo suppressalis]|nr:hypothetical protein evm_007379 [Chilo suppressalis]